MSAYWAFMLGMSVGTVIGMFLVLAVKNMMEE